MRAWQIAIVVAIAGVLGWGLVGFSSDRKTLERALAELSQKTEKLRSENRELEDRLVYLTDPRNLVKELKSQFNYREEGEKLVIIVPATASSTATTTLPGSAGGR
ncbi:MAG: septum formation initiator family protein [bacterium]|nr:septum formation initiator family protein [bacterium]